MEAGNFEVHLWLNMIWIREENKIKDFSSFALSLYPQEAYCSTLGPSWGFWKPFKKGWEEFGCGDPMSKWEWWTFKIVFLLQENHKICPC